jgi:Astacin (Peptidase family M12A)
MKIIEQRTCVRFVERTFEPDWAFVTNGGGCWSMIGRIGGRQELRMQRPGCFNEGIATHELMHLIGFHHMHLHQDRDNYVKIAWENIYPDHRDGYRTLNPQYWTNFNTPYDLLSILHYPRWASSVNGQNTIIPHDPRYLNIIGSTGRLSDGDAVRVNRMYNCIN